MKPKDRNVIRALIASLGLSEAEGLNLLDEAGLISNLCLNADDIPFPDAMKANDFLTAKLDRKG